jgi:hypothetical protein
MADHRMVSLYGIAFFGLDDRATPRYLSRDNVSYLVSEIEEGVSPNGRQTIKRKEIPHGTSSSEFATGV